MATAEVDDNNLNHLTVNATKSFTDSGAVINSGVEVHIKQQVTFVDDDSASIKYLEGVIKLGVAAQLSTVTSFPCTSPWTMRSLC
jgi:hypothetical protein